MKSGFITAKLMGLNDSYTTIRLRDIMAIDTLREYGTHGRTVTGTTVLLRGGESRRIEMSWTDVDRVLRESEGE